METKAIWLVPVALLLPGLYLLWFSIKKKEFFQEEEWRNWTGRAIIFADLIRLPHRFFGPNGARLTLGAIALCTVGLALWIFDSLIQ